MGDNTVVQIGLDLVVVQKIRQERGRHVLDVPASDCFFEARHRRFRGMLGRHLVAAVDPLGGPGGSDVGALDFSRVRLRHGLRRLVDVDRFLDRGIDHGLAGLGVEIQRVQEP